MSADGHVVEDAAKKHSGVLLLIQTVIGSILVLIAGNVYYVAKDANNLATEQAKIMVGVQVQLNTLQSQVLSVQTQLQGVTNIAMMQAKEEVKQAELERRIENLEHLRSLK